MNVTYGQSDGSDLSAANFSWNVFTHAFASLLNEAEHGRPADPGGMVGISAIPSTHNAFSLKDWSTIPLTWLSGSSWLKQMCNDLLTQSLSWLYLTLE